MLHFDIVRISVSCLPCSDQGISVLRKKQKAKDKVACITEEPEVVFPHSRVISLFHEEKRRKRKELAFQVYEIFLVGFK